MVAQTVDLPPASDRMARRPKRATTSRRLPVPVQNGSLATATEGPTTVRPIEKDLPASAYSEYAPPVPESERNQAVANEVIQRLRYFYRGTDQTYVWGDLCIYYRKNDRRHFLAPDVFVVQGVATHPRRAYLAWEEGVFPQFVLEVVSPRTWRRDNGVKKDL